MTQSAAAVTYLAGTLILAAACGTGAEDLFGGDPSQGDGGAPGGSADDDGGGLTSSSGGAGNTGNTGNVGNGSSTGGAGATGGAPTTSTGGAPTTSTGGSASGETLDCGPTTCDVAQGSACCWDEYELSAPPQAECVSGRGDACNNDVSNDGLKSLIECQLPSHCASGICCAHREFFQSGGQSYSYYPEVVCESSCTWTDVLICDPQAPSCPNVIVQGQSTPTSCVPSQLLPPGYYVCSPN